MTRSQMTTPDDQRAKWPNWPESKWDSNTKTKKNKLDNDDDWNKKKWQEVKIRRWHNTYQ